ncbi:MAG: iron-only hydrogenase system regulator [Clostridium sp.]|nr:iron-only hydrogenase system regulator [Clostridium sp.]
MDTRIAVIGIIVEEKESAGLVNEVLHQYSRFIIGRMGLPYEKKSVNIISVVVDAPEDAVSALSGKLGRIPGVQSKALYSKIGSGKKADKRAGADKVPGRK